MFEHTHLTRAISRTEDKGMSIYRPSIFFYCCSNYYKLGDLKPQNFILQWWRSEVGNEVVRLGPIWRISGVTSFFLPSLERKPASPGSWPLPPPSKPAMTSHVLLPLPPVLFSAARTGFAFRGALDPAQLGDPGRVLHFQVHESHLESRSAT